MLTVSVSQKSLELFTIRALKVTERPQNAKQRLTKMHRHIDALRKESH